MDGDDTGELDATLAAGAAPKAESMNRQETFEAETNFKTQDRILRTGFPGCSGAPAAVVAANCFCFPCYFLQCCGFFQLSERQHAAVLYCGKYAGSVDSPGIHCLPPLCREVRAISTATRTMDMKDLKVVDQRGNPVIISAVVTFIATSAKKARIDVENPWPNPSWQRMGLATGTFLQLQAQAVLKQVTSQFPYEAKPGMPSLQTEGAHITEQLVQKLQDRVNVTGAKILTFDLVDLSYAPEIAQSMLLRQQAAALVDARALIVNASVEMVHEAIELMDKKNISMGTQAKESIITNLMTVICSHTGVTPTVNVGESSEGKEGEAIGKLVNVIQRQQAMMAPTG